MSLTAFLPLQCNTDQRSGYFGSGYGGSEPGWDAWNLGVISGANQSTNLGSFDPGGTGSSAPTLLTADVSGSYETRVELRFYAQCPVAYTIIYHYEETPYAGGSPTNGADITATIGPNSEVIISIPVTFEVYTRMMITAIVAHPWN